MLTRADIFGRKMVDAVHIDHSRSSSAWMGFVEGIPRLGVTKGQERGVSFIRWYIDSKPVADLDAALAVLNGQKTLRQAIAEAERGPIQTFSIGAQISEVERELRMRRSVYDRMSFPNNTFKRRAEADMALAIMENVLRTLEWSRDNRDQVIEWVRSKKAEEKAA